MPSQPGKETIATHILATISRSKSHQTMKFGQLIEYNIKNIFLKKSTQNMVGKRVLDPFLKNQNWAYLWINCVKSSTACFYCMPGWGLSKHIKTKLQTICFYLPKAFLKNNKNMSGTNLLASFSAWFLRKNISPVIFFNINITWPDFPVWLPLLCEILSNMCIVIVC